jgi:hypothetical protein
VTPQERADEVQRLLHASGATLLAGGYRTFADVHKRIGELVGRDVYNHELVEPDRLCREILTGERPTLDDILGVLRRHVAPGAQIVVVDPRDPEDAAKALKQAGLGGDGS